MNTGGPAFPTLTRRDEQYANAAGYSVVRSVVDDRPGMSLRDYFAAAALTGICTRSPDFPGVYANEAYVIADAMLVARETKA